MMEKRKHKNKADYGTAHFYNKHQRKYENTNLGVIDSQKQYTRILTRFFELLLHEIFVNKYIYEPPHGFGELYLVKIKPVIIEKEDGTLTKTAPIDIRATIELRESDPEAKANGTIVRYQNFHTDGYYFKTFWNKKGTKFRNSRYYKLILTRKHNRELSRLIFEGEADTPFSATNKSELTF